jgi:hypothetical protein
MKKVACVLMLCLGVMACAVEDQDDPSTSATEDTSIVTPTAAPTAAAPAVSTATSVKVTGNELGTLDGGKTTASCSLVYQGVCVASYNTCNFECCSGAIRSIHEVCGNCLNRANSWCGSGVHQVWWTP